MSDPLTIIHGDALSSLRRLPDESVQCCVTSPPYWSLRDYGIEPLIWDASVECDHEFGAMERGKRKDILPQEVTTLTSRIGTDERQNGAGTNGGRFCHCGAWLGSLGLEPTPNLYVSHIVQIFRELKRVLRNDGTLWLNLGDSYAGGGGGSFAKDGIRAARPGTDKNVPARTGNRGVTVKSKRIPRGSGRWGGGNAFVAELKPKDLIGIPWMVAFALRADGWYLRSDIIWSKPNPMPESVLDRPIRSHEHIFLLSKSERYRYNADAIREPYNEASLDRYTKPMQGTDRNGGQIGGARQPGGVWEPKNQELNPNPLGRNRRSVWTITTKPFSDAHFATFPPDLITPCILAGAEAGEVVIDTFAGSGTTGKVAIELGRKAILIEPKAEYVEMIKRRCQTTIGLPITA